MAEVFETLERPDGTYAIQGKIDYSPDGPVEVKPSAAEAYRLADQLNRAWSQDPDLPRGVRRTSVVTVASQQAAAEIAELLNTAPEIGHSRFVADGAEVITVDPIDPGALRDARVYASAASRVKSSQPVKARLPST